MNLRELEEQVACAEERALNLSLAVFPSEEEFVETHGDLNKLDRKAAVYSCPSSQALRLRIAAARAELEAAQYLTCARQSVSAA